MPTPLASEYELDEVSSFPPSALPLASASPFPSSPPLTTPQSRLTPTPNNHFPPPRLILNLRSSIPHTDKPSAAELRSAKRTFERRQRILTCLLQVFGVCVAVPAIAFTVTQWKDGRMGMAQTDAQTAWMRRWEMFKYCGDLDVQYNLLNLPWDKFTGPNISLNDSSLANFAQQRSLQQMLELSAFDGSLKGRYLLTCRGDNLTVPPYAPVPNTLASFAEPLSFPPFSLPNLSIFQWGIFIVLGVFAVAWCGYMLFLMVRMDPEDIVWAERRATEEREKRREKERKLERRTMRREVVGGEV